MTHYVLWIALILLVLPFLLPMERGKYLVGALGWAVFSIHWASEPPKYLAFSDPFNAVLTAIVAGICLFIGFLMIRAHGQGEPVLLTVTRATAIGGIIYFSFAEVGYLFNWIISMTTELTVWGLVALNVPANLVDWNLIALNGQYVEIILACTALESIALFSGAILAVRAPRQRKILALLASVPVIYLLNLIRNVFVVTAYGLLWFSSNPHTSFNIAHNYIAKIGSTIALFAIAYVVFMLLPELLEMIDDLLDVAKQAIQRGEPI